MGYRPTQLPTPTTTRKHRRNIQVILLPSHRLNHLQGKLYNDQELEYGRLISYEAGPKFLTSFYSSLGVQYQMTK